MSNNFDNLISDEKLESLGKKSNANKELILDLVTFCILMENNDGIRGKSPAYILEKFRSAMSGNIGILDSRNQLKRIEYIQSWYNGDEQC